MDRKLRTAFTLIELLVVIAIIVVLISILMPSMEKAIYRATLMKCSTQLRGIGMGATTYVSSFKGYYPYRRAVMNYSNSEAGRLMRDSHDDRKTFDTFIEPDMFRDPLADCDIDYGAKIEGNYSAWTPYDMYFGFRYAAGDNGQMLRYGERLLSNDGKELNVLAVDDDSIRLSQNVSRGAHGDRKGRRQFGWYQDSSEMSTRWSGNNYQRGELDTNAALTDGSVETFFDVTWDDPRMARMPHYADNSPDPGVYWDHVPY